MVAYLFTGILFGLIIASAAWGFVLKTIKIRNENERKNLDELMHTIGELWVEIDSLIASFRSGIMDERSFKNVYTSKIDTINHILKPNMHLFDVYYVKYIENLIKDYNRRTFLKEQPEDTSAVDDFNSEMETTYGPVPQSEQTDLFKSQIEEVDDGETLQNNLAYQRDTFETTHRDQSFVNEPAPAFYGAVREDESDIKNASEPVSDEVDSMFEEAFSSFNDSAPSGADLKNEIPRSSSENIPSNSDKNEAFDVYVASKESPQNNESIDMVDFDQRNSDKTADATDVNLDHSISKENQEQGSDRQHSHFNATFNDISEESEEDFSMETLMDVELSAITAHLKEDDPNQSTTSEHEIEKTRHFTLLPEKKSAKSTDKSELDIIIASNAVHNNIPEKDTTDKESPTLIQSPPDIDNKKSETDLSSTDNNDKGFDVIIPEKSETTDSELEVENTDDIDITITPAIKSGRAPVEKTNTGDTTTGKIPSTEPELAADTIEQKSGTALKKNKTPLVKKTVMSETKIATKKKNKKIRQTTSEKTEEESITGDDVADQIDSFFGLFK